MTHDDAEPVLRLTWAAWGEDGRESGLVRMHHLVDTDPGGAWVTEDDAGEVDGAALALVREGLWGLSLLIVREDRQSAGRGRELMRAALAYGAGTSAGLIIASEDPRAMRTYWRAGFALRPAFDAKGEQRRTPRAHPSVRPARWPADRDLVDAASRAARGAAHGTDIDAQLRQQRRLLVHDDGGFLVADDSRVHLVAAHDERVARALLETSLHEQPGEVHYVEGRQEWALDVALEAGLELVAGSSVCVRGDLGPLRPYLPSGAYL